MSVPCLTCLVTGLDFHTVPDSVAPHSHGHPHWVSHPSRWSIDLLCLSWRCAVNCVSSHSSAFSLLVKPFMLAHKRLHPCWLCPWLSKLFFPLALSDVSTWVDLRFQFCLHLNLCDTVLPISITQNIPSILGWDQVPEHSTQAKNAYFWLPSSLRSLLGLCCEYPLMLGSEYSMPSGCYTDEVWTHLEMFNNCRGKASKAFSVKSGSRANGILLLLSQDFHIVILFWGGVGMFLESGFLCVSLTGFTL